MSTTAAMHVKQNDPATPLGGWIRRTRTEQGFSQRELASRSGLSRSYVCDIERGRGAHPSVQTLDKLAAALGFSRIDLLKASGVIDQGDDRRQDDEERRMLSVFRDLSAQGRLSVMQFARFIHTDEHLWVQANMMDGLDGLAASHPVVDRLTKPLFEDADT